MLPIVSIIVPIYNLEQYISTCLKSLINQTYYNLEILCIDDGSKDDSANIINNFILSDNRIKYFYQENAGVSAARNFALKIATGDYVIFVDGDDYLHPRAIEFYVDCAIKNNADIVFSDYCSTYNNDETMPEIQDYSHREFVYTLGSAKDSALIKPIGGKFIKTSLAKSHFFLQDVCIGEDLNYAIKLINDGNNIQHIQNKLYYYLLRYNSASKKEATIKELSVIKAYEDLYKAIKNSSKKDLVAYSLQGIIMTLISYRTLTKHSPLESDFKKIYKSVLNKWLGVYIKSNFIPLSQKIITMCFLFFRPLYELSRLLQDPTMADFYKNRKKRKNK